MKKKIPVMMILLALIMMVFTGTIYAKSLYVITDINANPTPISAYNINVDGTITLQSTHQVPRHGWGAVGLAIDTESEFLFVTYEMSSTIELVDARTMTSVGNTNAPGARNLAGIVVDQSRQKVYTIDRNTSNLYIYSWDASSKTLTLDGGSYITVPGSTGFGMALDEINGMLYVANNNSTVTYYSTSDFTMLAGSINVGAKAVGIAVDTVNNYLYTGAGWGSGRHNNINQYNLSTGETQSKYIGSNEGVMGISVDILTGNVFCTTGQSGDRVIVYDKSLNYLYATARIGNPTGLVVPGTEVSFNPLNINIDHNYPWGFINPGSEIKYTISYNNLENDQTVTNVKLVSYLPPELEYIPWTASDGGEYDSTTRSIKWDYISDLPGNASQQSVTFFAQVSSNVLHGTLATTYVTINGDQIPPTTTSVGILVSDQKLESLKLDTPIMGKTSAFLQWGAYGPYDEYTYEIYIWNRTYSFLSWSSWELVGILDQIDEEDIRVPKAIVEDLKKSKKYPIRLEQYAFQVRVLDSKGNESGRSESIVYGTTAFGRDDDPIPIPTNPIVLVPGVGSTVTDGDLFKALRKKFNELGWKDAPQGTVLYKDENYFSDSWEFGGLSFKNILPNFSEDVFTFVPYRPTSGHEIGIGRKGIELGYFLHILNHYEKITNFQLVGHSLGGLTIRAYIQNLEIYNNDVVRVVTTGSPHNGVLADHFNYPQRGVKDIILDGYFTDTWRKLAWYLHGIDDLRAKIKLNLTFKYLEDGILLWGGGWDFDGVTLYGRDFQDGTYQLADVINGSDFLSDLNFDASGVYGHLPAINYVSLVGDLKSFGNILPHWGGLNSYLGFSDSDGDKDYTNWDASGSIVDGGDGFISIGSQNLNTVAQRFSSPRDVRVIKRLKNHKALGSDHIGILMGLGYPTLSIKANSPVELEVIAPSGEYMAKYDAAMFLATYREFWIDGRDTPHTLVEIPFPEDGDYLIYVHPTSEAAQDDTFTLLISRNGEEFTVIHEGTIDEIDPEGYHIAGNIINFESIREQVEYLKDNGSLNRGQAGALLATLSAAEQNYDTGNIKAAINNLGAFINQVEAFIRGGILDETEGYKLVDQANFIINKLEKL